VGHWEGLSGPNVVHVYRLPVLSQLCEYYQHEMETKKIRVSRRLKKMIRVSMMWSTFLDSLLV